MAGKLGADFNVNLPGDDDLVKKGAGWIRDTRARLRAFVSTLFNPDTGDLLPGVVKPSNLADIVSAGQGTLVTINSKGLVTGLSTPVATPPGATLYRARFTVASRFVWNHTSTQLDTGVGTGMTDSGDSQGQGLSVVQYSFTVPAYVYSLLLRLVGGGGGGEAENPTLPSSADLSNAGVAGGQGGGYVEYVMPVTPNEVLTVWVGQGGTARGDSAAQGGGMSRVYISSTRYAKALGGNAGNGGGEGGLANGTASGFVGYTATGQLGSKMICTWTHFASAADWKWIGGSGGHAGNGSLVWGYGGGPANQIADGPGNGGDGYVDIDYVAPSPAS